MVLGDSTCGAVKAAIEHIDANDALPGSIGDLIDPIRLAVAAAVKDRPGELSLLTLRSEPASSCPLRPAACCGNLRPGP
jgi:carbonic anhydrase